MCFLEEQGRIDIILVNYNAKDDTIECVDSILKSNYSCFRIIIVDNASDFIIYNELKCKYAEEKRVTLLRLEENLGFSGGNNIGIKYAQQGGAEYVLILNNDTTVKYDFLERLIEVAQKQDDLYIMTGKICYYDNPQKIWCAGGTYNKYKGTVVHNEHNFPSEQSNECREVDFICGCFWFMKCRDIEYIGYWPEEFFLYSEDLDYSLCAKEKGYKLLYIPQSEIYHKVSATTSKNSGQMQYYIIRNRFYVICKRHKGIKKISALIFSSFWCLKHIFNKSFEVKFAARAVYDVACGKMGRAEWM